jgi:hypothetical protein
VLVGGLGGVTGRQLAHHLLKVSRSPPSSGQKRRVSSGASRVPAGASIAIAAMIAPR